MEHQFSLNRAASKKQIPISQILICNAACCLFLAMACSGCYGFRAVNQYYMAFPTNAVIATEDEPPSVAEVSEALEIVDSLLIKEHTFNRGNMGRWFKRGSHWEYYIEYEEAGKKEERDRQIIVSVEFKSKKNRIEICLIQRVGWRMRGSKEYRDLKKEIKFKLEQRFGEGMFIQYFF